MCTVVLALAACGGGGPTTEATGPAHPVRLEVSSKTSPLTVSYRVPGKAVANQRVSTPWLIDATARAGDELSLSAQNDGSLNEVTVTVWVDGKVFRRDTASGAFSVAGVQGICC